MSLARTFARLLILSLAVLGAQTAAAKTLKVGITLHPYYSFVASIVGDRADVVPLIAADANPHGYTPQASDMVRMRSMDVLVVNGIGHDTWAFEILEAAGVRDRLKLIHANDGVSLIPVVGTGSAEKVVNPHTFISTTAAIQQVYTIARELVNTLFMATVGAVALALGLAFGIGGRDTAAEVVRNWYDRSRGLASKADEAARDIRTERPH